MESKNNLRSIPGIDELLQQREVKQLIDKYGHELCVFCTRQVIDRIREVLLSGGELLLISEIVKEISEKILQVAELPLKPMLNGTGVILHTNLGRAPLGKKVMEEISPFFTNYCNLEFDLKTGKRGQRNNHLKTILSFITKAEDSVVVNNNAAAVLLILKALAKGREVIISRGEMIEIGGGFRIPEIISESGAKLVEVGTTNRTRLSDYEKAINENTSMILKAHKSNYYIGGFTEEVELSDLSKLAKANNIPFVYDLGSGLLRRPEALKTITEPDVLSSITAGCDLVSFSGDKLLGGIQAGIITGKRDLIRKISQEPLMRALRVDKITFAILHTVFRQFLHEENLLKYNPTFQYLSRSNAERKRLAQHLKIRLRKSGIASEVIESMAQSGGGTLPDLEIPSYGVKLLNYDKAKLMFQRLLSLDKPILGVLKEGYFYIDMFCLNQEDVIYTSFVLGEIYKEL